MLIKKENIDYNPNLPESDEYTRYAEVTDPQSINKEFHKAFQKFYAKQNVDDSSEAIRNFLASGNKHCHQNSSPTELSQMKKETR